MKGYVEYKMPVAQIKAILSTRKNKEKKGSNQKYLCDYVKNNYGVLGTVTRVVGE